MSIEESVSSTGMPARDHVLENVKRIVAETMGIGVDTVDESHALEADLGCDSLERVEILMEVEEQFGINATDDVDEKVRTVGDIADAVLEQLGDVKTQSGRG